MSGAERAQWRWRWLPVAAAGAGAVVAGSVLGRHRFIEAYLVAWLFFVGIGVGALAIALLHRLTGGAWGELIRGPLEKVLLTLPLLAILFVPIALSLGDLYAWTRPGAVASDPALQAKALYLHGPFFVGRATVCLVSWAALAVFLLRRPPETVASAGRTRRVAAIGLVVLGLTVTVASIDWILTLEPHWFSTVFGLLTGTGFIVGAYAFAIAARVAGAAGRGEAIDRDALHDVGNLLFAFLLIWAYLGFCQYFLIWSGDLPEETTWYLRRTRGALGYVGVAILALHFAVPFALLLSRALKRSARALAGVAALVLVMRVVDTWWTVAPALPQGGLDPVGVAAPLGLGAVFFGAYGIRG